MSSLKDYFDRRFSISGSNCPTSTILETKYMVSRDHTSRLCSTDNSD